MRALSWLVTAGLAACGPGAPAARPGAPPPPALTAAEPDRDGCPVVLPIVRRCVSPALSPGEPYLLEHPEGIIVVLRATARDEHGSIAPRLEPDARWLAADAPRERRADIEDHAEMRIPCDALPPVAGTYSVSACPPTVDAAACGQAVTATGWGVIDLEYPTPGRPRVRVGSGVAGERLQVTYAPDNRTGRCGVDPYDRPLAP